MTTDPRIIECAKVLHDPWDRGVLNSMSACREAAKVVALKWLEQGPSDDLLIEMTKRIEQIRNNSDPSGIAAASLFNLMCAQAAKEITGATD